MPNGKRRDKHARRVAAVSRGVSPDDHDFVVVASARILRHTFSQKLLPKRCPKTFAKSQIVGSRAVVLTARTWLIAACLLASGCSVLGLGGLPWKKATLLVTSDEEGGEELPQARIYTSTTRNWLRLRNFVLQVVGVPQAFRKKNEVFGCCCFPPTPRTHAPANAPLAHARPKPLSRCSKLASSRAPC
jgi:hypothetical protein